MGIEDGTVYVADYLNHQIVATSPGKGSNSNGRVVAGGKGRGNDFHQFNVPTLIAVDGDDALYVSDNNNHRVMKWSKGATQGIAVLAEWGAGRQ